MSTKAMNKAPKWNVQGVGEKIIFNVLFRSYKVWNVTRTLE